MGFFNQFDRFSPLSGDVPSYPLSYLPEIAWRARSLIKSRTAEQIRSVADEIDWAISSYFETIKNNEIARLESVLAKPRRWKREPDEIDSEYDYAAQFFDWDGGTVANGHFIFNGRELDIQTSDNTSEVTALMECLDGWVDIGCDDFPDGKDYEYFAVLSLWLLADAIHRLNYREKEARKLLDQETVAVLEKLDEMTRKSDQLVAELDLTDDMEYLFGSAAFLSPYELNLVMASEHAFKAMDAVCHAEKLFKISNLKLAHVKKEAAKQEDERKRRSMKAEALNIARHRLDYEAKDLVLKEWEKETSKFSSGEKAGLHFADWLLKQELDADARPLYDYQPRQVATWIRAHAKQIGVRFR